MVKDNFDNQIEGQMSLADLYEPPERLFAVSRIFARARKEMSLNEQKTLVYALSEMRFTEEPKSMYVTLDKKTLAGILGLTTEDPDHLSGNLYDEVKDMPKHSFIEIADKDKELYMSGCIITTVARFKNVLRIKFNSDYMGLFTNLSTNYITMWSTDIFKMSSKRSVQFYEYLRTITDNRNKTNSVGLGIKALKEMFDIPKEGKGSYMSKEGHFLRTSFEKYVIEPLCADLQKCRMINLILQPDGKPYEKVKQGNRVNGYRFYWTFTEHPAVASAAEVKQIQDRVDKNPEVLKVAKDLLESEKKPKKKKNSWANEYDFEELERILLKN